MSNEKPSKDSKQNKQTKIRSWAIIGGSIALIVLIIVLFCKGCTGGDVLKGTWDLDGTTVYQFDGKGEGAMILPSNTYSFKYTINEEEKTVSIDFDNEKATDYTYSYTVDKNSLTLYGSIGKESFEYVFAKQDD